DPVAQRVGSSACRNTPDHERRVDWRGLDSNAGWMSSRSTGGCCCPGWDGRGRTGRWGSAARPDTGGGRKRWAAAAVEVPDPVRAVVGGRQPVGLGLPGPAEAVPGPDRQRPELVEGEAPA